MPNKSKVEMWKDKKLASTGRLRKPAAVERDEIDDELLEQKISRGDLIQKARLRFYPSIEIDFFDFYAGSVSDLSLTEVEDVLFDIGFRNNPIAYVEVTDKFGPDDGSFARQFITEDDEFPYLGTSRPLGVVTWWNRIKIQYHVTTFVDEDRGMIHILCHRESSAWLQPARHLTVSEPEGKIGSRDFRDFWEDEFGEELPAPMGLPASKR